MKLSNLATKTKTRPTTFRGQNWGRSYALMEDHEKETVRKLSLELPEA